ncbi:PLDc N-terminal domain-containing protein [Nakamurella deserti]|uniref:PLDc N-terminal domain-containing protein n=1 Tax=Nakamurella deserti TaxID=2164074 RepID=UPI00197CB2F4|nr:PLDc N-terminal domain-containing protein [Nakamurella deserti]
MLYLDGILLIAVLALWVYCIVEILQTPDSACRHLPRIGWLVLVVLLPLIGSVGWLLAGRPQGTRNAQIHPTPGYPEYERLGRALPQDPTADEEFLRQVRARAEEQRARYREQQRRERDGQL